MKSLKDILDNNENLSNETKELMETLFMLAEQKAEVFLMRIMDSINKEDDKKLPVTALVDEEKVISALVKNDVENLESLISNFLDLIVKHNKKTVVEKIKDSLVVALKTLLGSSSAQSDSIEKYYILIEDHSAVRLDIKFWYHSVESTSLHEHCEKITCTVATKSIVDLSKIDISTFLYIYQNQLISSEINKEDLEQELENVRKIYDKFQQSMKD